MNLKSFLFVLALTNITINTGYCQDLVVLSIQGKVKTGKVNAPISSYTPLKYGLVESDQVLFLEKNSKVKLIHLNGSVWAFNQTGSYPMSSIISDKSTFMKKETKDGFGNKGSKMEELSIMSQFGDYFVSFFQKHKSSDSKEDYNNSVYAISRGEPAILLEYPFTGIYPVNKKKIVFSWAHACDTCTYEITLSDKNQNIIFRTTTKEKSYSLNKPSKHLSYGTSYNWKITTKSAAENYSFNKLTITDYKHYKQTISNLENEINTKLVDLDHLPKTALMLSSLQDSDQLNYAYIYGQQMKVKYPKDKALQDLLDRFYFVELKKRLSTKDQ